MTDDPSPDRHKKDTGSPLGPVTIAPVAAANQLPAPRDAHVKMRARSLWVRYGEKIGIKDVTIDINANEVLALIGPSGCGKSTFLRSLNRMNDTVPGIKVEGQVELDGDHI